MGIGIDFGTSFTVAAYVADGKPRMIEFDYDRTAFPSAVYITESGALIFGRDAELLGQAQPERLLLSFKRDLGRGEPYIIGGASIGPNDAVTCALHHVRASASTKVASFNELTPIVLTTPATFASDGEKASALLNAAVAAGFSRQQLSLLPEPVAAGIGWQSGDWPKPSLAQGATLIVYDLGGGTFDAAAIRLAGGAGPLMPVGDERIGGDAFDHAILKTILAGVGPDQAALYQRPEDQALLPEWRARSTLALRACREAKERLSKLGQSPIVLPGVQQAPSLRLDELERLLTPMLERTILLTQQLATDLERLGEPPAAIMLVGGGSRLPLVKQLLERLELPILEAPDPGRIVAMGAAVHAARLGAQAQGYDNRRSKGDRDKLMGGL